MPKLDLMSHSDPFAVLYVPRHQVPMVHDASGASAGGRAPGGDASQDWVEVGRTERLKNCPHPHFTTPFVVDFAFEERQPLLVEFYDSDRQGAAALAAHDYIGSAALTVADVVGNAACKASRPLRGADGKALRGGATLTMTGEEVAECSNVLRLRLRGKKLKNHDGPLGLSDPFIDFCKAAAGSAAGAGGAAAGFTRVFHTEVVMDSLNPVWAPLEVPVQTLCNGDMRRAVQINVWDWDADGGHDFMGSVITSVEQLLAVGAVRGSLSLVDARGKARGSIVVDEAALEQHATFLDYLHAGLQLPLTCAIDFTASNRAGAADGSSLHAVHDATEVAAGRRNDYQHAICAIAPILEPYSVTPVIEAFGFGAKLKGAAAANHHFVLTDVPRWPVFNPAASPPGVTGTAGLLAAYGAAITSPNLKLYGPTNFAPTLRRVRDEVAQRMVQLAQYRQGGMDDLQFVRHLPFTLVLILTDGVITDLADTKDEIVRCSHLPISVIIVGVGRAQFDSMVELDADQHALTASNGEVARRDIVQFVPFNDFVGKEGGMEEALARETLAELPGQVMEYMAMEGVRIPVHVAPIAVEEMQTLQMGIAVAEPVFAATAPPAMAQPVMVGQRQQQMQQMQMQQMGMPPPPPFEAASGPELGNGRQTRSDQAERGKIALGYALQGGV